MVIRPGDRLGRYKIIGLLGAGGMGEVFCARDDRLEREVAIKVLPEAVSRDPERLSRFSREAKAVAALSHPNILEIYDFVGDGGVHFAVTELLDGRTLRELIDEGRSDWRSAVSICAAVADGLAAAHKKGIIHRDLKPENVVVTRDDLVKILDFGLAKILRADSTDVASDEAPTASMGTDPGAVMGTVGYMSPEQVRGDPVDHRTDIFSLGCLLHELISGRSAFPGRSRAEIDAAILDRQPALLAPTGGALPEEVQLIVDRCLQKSPRNRFQDAGDLAFALRSLTTVSGSESSAPAPKKHRWWPLAAATAVLVVIAAVVGFLRGRDEAGPLPQKTTGLNPELVSVAPFENRTGNPELDDLGLVAADWLTNTLARIDGAGVVPIGMGAETRTGATTPLEVANTTGAGIVVTGAYSLDGESLRFQANLTDAVRGTLLSSLEPVTAPVDQPMASIDSLSSRVAGAVAGLFANWDPAFDQNFTPPGYEAYREYIAGLDYFGIDNQLAFKHWNRAVDIEPDFVAPQMMMVSLLRVSGRHVQAQEIIDRLSEERQRMNPFERVWLEYHTAILDGDNRRALSQMRRNHELAPRSTLIRFGLARNLLLNARPRETLEVISELDDLDNWAGSGACSFLFSVKMNAEHVLGRFGAELETARRGAEVCGNKVVFQNARARAQIGKGHVEGVEDALNDGLKASDARSLGSRLLLDVACELDAHGHPGLALDVAARGVQHVRNHIELDEATEWQRIRYAQLLTMIGQHDEADQVLSALNKEIPGDDDILGWLGIVAAMRGDSPAAEHFSKTLREEDSHPYLHGWFSFYRAAISAHLGRPDEALSLLRVAFSGGYPWGVDLHSSLELKPLRGHPEFEAILHPEE